ncbi:MAG: hypothetical protein INR68_12855 [Methylobacterium mesophilicum]|nr:hypothetical protein [Methylobacterium mesophilicum]
MPDPVSNSAHPDIRTPNADGIRGEQSDELLNDERQAPKAPAMSGGTKPDANPLDAPPDLRDAGEPTEPLRQDDPRTGR